MLCNVDYNPGPIRVQYVNKLQMHVSGDGSEVFHFSVRVILETQQYFRKKKDYFPQKEHIKTDINSNTVALSLKSKFTLVYTPGVECREGF